MKFVLILIVLGGIAWLSLQETQNKSQTKQDIIKQFEGLPDCQNQAIAAGNAASSDEEEIAASRRQMQECMKDLQAR